MEEDIVDIMGMKEKIMMAKRRTCLMTCCFNLIVLYYISPSEVFGIIGVL